MTRYPIGLVGDLNHLRPHLESASFNPHGGSFGHPDTTSDIDALLRRDLRTPLLVSVRDSDPTWSSWFGRLLDSGARVVVVGWGSSWGAITAAVRRVRQMGLPIAQLQVRHLNPLPANLGVLLRRGHRIIVPEVNLGQFSTVLRAKYLVDAQPWSRVRGRPLSVTELTEHLLAQVEEAQRDE